MIKWAQSGSRDLILNWGNFVFWTDEATHFKFYTSWQYISSAGVLFKNSPPKRRSLSHVQDLFKIGIVKDKVIGLSASYLLGNNQRLFPSNGVSSTAKSLWSDKTKYFQSDKPAVLYWAFKHLPWKSVVNQSLHSINTVIAKMICAVIFCLIYRPYTVF